MLVRVTKVLVIGAGIGGLTAGLTLRRANIETAIFERKGSVLDLQVGHGLTLWPNSTRILANVGALEDVEHVGAAIEQMERRDILIAADGAQSTIRSLLLHDAPTPTGNVEMHGTVPTPPDVPTGLYRQ